MNPKTDPAIIRKLRKEQNMTQEQLGALCGMNKSQISKIENGSISNPLLHARVLNALGYTVETSIQASRFPYSTEQILDVLRDFKDRNGEELDIEQVALYGSCARRTQSEKSDIDVAVKMKKPNLVNFITICDRLQELFSVKVDTISLTARFLNGFMDNISKDLIYV